MASGIGERSKRVRFRSFSSDWFAPQPPSRQFLYLNEYLCDLGATSLIEEPHYFDRDYLAEFSAFYAISSKGYPNVCRRFHFFSGKALTRSRLTAALGGSERTAREMQANYLGFVVMRPIPAAPLGRSVFRWYPDNAPATPRVVTPSREYQVHLAGLPLTVRGLAWQQQDSGVGACATIALWSMLHSSAFDAYHAIPTTADITTFAHKSTSHGHRPFPSIGLSLAQLCGAIVENGMSPVVTAGDRSIVGSSDVGFSAERFSCLCASLIRSGYPVLLFGKLLGLGGHAICAVGFREKPPSSGARVELQDGAVDTLYVHDDNLGPNVRLTITEDPRQGVVVLRPTSPPALRGRIRAHDPLDGYPDFVPTHLLAARHKDLRVSPDALNRLGLNISEAFVFDLPSGDVFSPTTSSRFMKIAEYTGAELGRMLGGLPRALSKARLGLAEAAPPMSLHVGLVRLGYGSAPLLDVLCDTTETDRNVRAFCHVIYHPVFRNAHAIAATRRVDLGTAIAAYA